MGIVLKAMGLVEGW